MVSFSIISCFAKVHFVQNVGKQSIGEGDDGVSESSNHKVSIDSSSSSLSLSLSDSSMQDIDPEQVVDRKIQDSKLVHEKKDDNDGRGTPDGSKEGMGNTPIDEGKSRPLYGGKYFKGMEWILQKLMGEPELLDDSPNNAKNVEMKDSVRLNGSADLLQSGNETTASATAGTSSNSINETNISNVSTSQWANASHSNNVSGSGATNVTNSNSTSPNLSPSGGSSAALTLVKLFLATLYVAGPSAGIFLISPIYAIATRNLMDYFIGSPETVDLLHGAGIMGLVVDLTWGAVD